MSQIPAATEGSQANTSTAPESLPSSTNNKDNYTNNPASDNSKPRAKADNYPHHVIFVVHGMGRQLEEFGNYERNVGYLVENTKIVLQSQFHELKTDVHIIPIEWHAKLHGMVDERMSLASLRTVPKDFNNHFGAEIVRMIVDELNEAYSTFITKHPDFNGKIAIYALSLGGVAMFDILTCMDDDEPEAEEDQQSKKDTTSGGDKDIQGESVTSSESEAPKKKPRLRRQDQPKFRTVIPKLNFRPNILFTVGSPVAYRMEPLIDPIFAAIPAVRLASTGNSQLFPISLPSLSSLPSIPETITSFWENKVSGLPKPSIPTLSTLSQMTQSLKAGRWLSGAVSGKTTEELTSNEYEDGNNIENKKLQPNSGDGLETGDTNSQEKDELSQTMDKDVSVTEAIAAAAVATYLDQSGAIPIPPAPELMMDNSINTTTSSTSKTVPSPVRRPSLGPSRISSRADDEQVNQKTAATKFSSTERVEEEGSIESTTQAASQNQEQENLEGVTLMDIERLVGMENEPSATEKAQGVGAKSDVVLEDIVRSAPSDDRDENDPEGGIEGMQARHVEQEKAKNREESENNRRTTVTDEEEKDGPSEGKQGSSTIKDGKKRSLDIDTSRSKIFVGARETNVPYRIDHVLQETTVDQYTNEYLLGMRSHFKYWGNRDIAYHILKSILKPGNATENGTLNLQPEMPAPVTAPKNVREAAEARARAAGVAYHQNQEQQQGPKKAFSFSLSSYRNPEKEESKDSNRGQGNYSAEDVEQLYGYRYADLDVNSAADVAFSSNTLYQNSPFVKKPWEQQDEHGQRQGQEDQSHHSTKGRVSSPDRAQASSVSEIEKQSNSPPVQPRAFDEALVVPDLARPPKSHYRTSRVEERRNRSD
ncbi:Phospholipase ddhd1 [Haplosporangium sp. Z 27]|nr:Phospholipase ddhd1 [Haplosporangium sp. Z 27]